MKSYRENMRFFKIWLFSFFLSVFIFFNCSSKQHRQQQKAPQYGGTLNITCSAQMENLDPQKILFRSDWKVASFIYEGLITLGENHTKVLPSLAVKWQKSDYGKHIIFDLSRNIFFQDDPCFPAGKGRRLTAEDILYTFKRIANPKTACPNWYQFEGKIEGIDAFHKGNSENISGIRVINEHRIEFRLTKPYYSFLKILASPAAFIVPREAVKYYGKNLFKHPVGTGPFRLVRWRQLQELVLIRNEKYRQKDAFNRQLPYLDGIRIHLSSNPVLTIPEFLNGHIQLLKANEKTFRQLQAEKKFGDRFKIAKITEDFHIRMFGFSMDKKTSLSQNPAIRQAIALCFNRDKLNNKLSDPIIIANSLVPPFLFKNYAPDWYRFNPQKAQQLLDREIQTDQLPTVSICSNIRGEAVQTLFGSMQKLGIRCKIDFHPVHFYQDIVKNRPDIFRFSFYPGYPDPEEYYALFYSKSSPTINLTGYTNPEFDRILEAAMVEQNDTKREQYFKQLEQTLKTDLPALYISHAGPVYYITTKNFHGLQMRSTIPDFSRVWFGKQNAAQN